MGIERIFNDHDYCFGQCLGVFKHNVSKQTQFLKPPWQWRTASRISHIQCNTSTKIFTPLAYIDNVTLLDKA